ncbi:hypothetical protein ACFP56_15830 [Paenibacillus septentrionalis]|uniref:AraC family transcriptional regulator n=1 Tax=Paenibacillus septentrionalis TaxID=429342 RepID=A0ABW1V814_9BACL
MENVITIETGKSLSYKKVASFRKKMQLSEMNEQVLMFIDKLKDLGLTKLGPMLSTTHGMEIVGQEQVLDIEYLVAIDREVNLEEPYVYKPELKLVNALYVRHIGNPHELQDVYNHIVEFMKDNGLQQISTIYNVNINDDRLQFGEEPIIDIYLSINPNSF